MSTKIRILGNQSEMKRNSVHFFYDGIQSFKAVHYLEKNTYQTNTIHVLALFSVHLIYCFVYFEQIRRVMLIWSGIMTFETSCEWI
jgi:hypothetical protein